MNSEFVMSESFLQKANKAYFSKSYEECLVYVNLALDSGENNIWLYIRRALCSYYLGMLNEAKKDFEYCIKKNVKQADVFYCYAKCMISTDPQKALAFFKKSVEIDGKYLFHDWGMNHTKTLKNILDVRLFQFYKVSDSPYKELLKLLEKDEMNRYMSKHGFKLPKVYDVVNSISELKIENYPNKFVIKPVDGFNSNNVYVCENGIDLFRRKKLSNLIEQLKINKNEGIYIVEELIDDVDLDKDPYLKIPRDFKVFAAQGRVYWVNVYNRNARPKLRSMVSYDAKWNKLSSMTSSYLEGYKEEKPKYFDEMLDQARLISSQFPMVLRLDFYLSDRGPIFGEFTPFPGDFINATEFGNRTMLQLFEIYPD